MSGVHDGAGHFGINAGQADVEAGLQTVGVAGHDQVDFGIRGRFRGQGDFEAARGQSHGSLETGPPAGGRPGCCTWRRWPPFYSNSAFRFCSCGVAAGLRWWG